MKDDYAEVHKLLGGYLEFDKRQLARRLYHKTSKDEAAGRAALVKMLRATEPLSREIRDLLASLFDADPNKDDYRYNIRKLVFEFRERGNRVNTYRTTRIAEFIRLRVRNGEKNEAAFQAAMSTFKLSRSNVVQAWTRHLKDYEIFGWYDPATKTFKGGPEGPIRPVK
jgi:hypothetical protein